MTMCDKLHKVLEKGKKFNCKSDINTMPQNGVYILYEKGEGGHGGDRIVRIGTDTGENQLLSRIFTQHFGMPNKRGNLKENKNRSIFRKNIGRAILNRDANPYLLTWNCDPTIRENKEKFKDDAHLQKKQQRTQPGMAEGISVI